jgi:hypothetical protein
VLHQCDSPVSHFTPESHTSSTRDPTRKNFARDGTWVKRDSGTKNSKYHFKIINK